MARLDEAMLVRWGRGIGARVERPVTIALEGPLGAGKSVLARAIGAGAGVDEPMPSPTYNLVFRYAARSGSVVHFDLYRVVAPDELWELGWSELGREAEIVLVEWPERAGPHLPDDRWVVELSVAEGAPSLRNVTCRRVGDPPALPPPTRLEPEPPS